MSSWTKEPPKEPGFWWCRRVGCHPFTVETTMRLGDLVAVRSGYSFGACEKIDIERFDDHEWSPIPITPPSEERT